MEDQAPKILIVALLSVLVLPLQLSDDLYLSVNYSTSSFLKDHTLTEQQVAPEQTQGHLHSRQSQLPTAPGRCLSTAPQTVFEVLCEKYELPPRPCFVVVLLAGPGRLLSLMSPSLMACLVVQFLILGRDWGRLPAAHFLHGHDAIFAVLRHDLSVVCPCDVNYHDLWVLKEQMSEETELQT